MREIVGIVGIVVVAIAVVVGVIYLLSNKSARIRVRFAKDKNEVEGIRYFLPAPYLLVQPKVEVEPQKAAAGAAGVSGTAPPGPKVTTTYEAKVVWLPDRSREYAIQQEGSLGKNSLEVAITDGWNLTSLKSNQEYSPGEEVKAAAEGIAATLQAAVPSPGAIGVAAGLPRTGVVPEAALYAPIFSTDGVIEAYRKVKLV